MPFKNYTVYDNQDFFEKYIEKRKRGNAPNETLEAPIIEELIGDIVAKDVLELGCGSGAYGRALWERKIQSYLGIDGSANMIELAKENFKNTSAQLLQMDIEQFAFPKKQYDLVLSRLVFHYIENLAPLLDNIFQALKPKGELVFSIEHPIITSCYEAHHADQKRGNWIVDNYFKSGERVNNWIGKEVVKQHRTIEAYFYLLKQTGFIINDIRESQPRKVNFSNPTEYNRRMRIPLFMLFKTTKP